MTERALRLPPLGAVRVFEAAARHLNFTKAAAELGMTQAAVSYQIKLLEDRVGAPLFQREARRVSLTDMGQQLAPHVTDALERLTSAFANLRDDDAKVLKITTLQSFASNWLLPRLGRFQAAHPDIAVWIDTSGRMVDLATEGVDMAIRSGHGDWPGLVAHRLMDLDFTPVASPALLASIGGVKIPEDLLRLPLFREDDDSWERWFEEAGLKVAPGVARGHRWPTQQMAGRAAADSQGVALVHPSFFAEDLCAGRLIQPLPTMLRFHRAYYLVYPSARRNLPKLRAFRDWILDEFAADQS